MTRFRMYIPVLAVAALAVALQLVVSASGAAYYMTQIIMSAYYALVVIGLCLLMGYAGQVSLGHAGFFAIGGYVCAVLTTMNLIAWRAAAPVAWARSLGLLIERKDLYGADVLTFAAWPAFVAALVIAAVIGLLIGLPVLRLKGHYLAMATLGFGLIIYRIVLGAEVFGRADGISAIQPFPLGFGLQVNGRLPFRVQNYYIAWAAVLVAMVLSINLVHSRVGRALRSIHQNEEAAHSLGINTYRYKLATFVLSAVFAAAGGALLTFYNGSIGPSEAGVMKSVRYVAIVAVGGMANLWGALFMGVLLNFLSLRGVFGTYDDISLRRHPHRHHGLRAGRASARAAPAASPSPVREEGRMTDVLLETKGLNRSFGGLHAVRDVSFSVRAGAIQAVIGPNGAGKTTLFNLIAGTLSPHSGGVFFAGKAITAWKPHAVAALGIARTFQTTKLFPHMSVLENVMVGRHCRGRSGFVAGMLNLPRTWSEDRRVREKSLEILDDLGLASHAAESAGELPFGIQRLVEFARALAMEPRLLLLDEPAAGLNIYETKALAGLITRIRDRGVTCLVVEHDMSLVMDISDSVIVLDQGRKIAEGPPRAIQRDPEVIRVYLGDGHA